MNESHPIQQTQELPGSALRASNTHQAQCKRCSLTAGRKQRVHGFDGWSQVVTKSHLKKSLKTLIAAAREARLWRVECHCRIQGDPATSERTLARWGL